MLAHTQPERVLVLAPNSAYLLGNGKEGKESVLPLTRGLRLLPARVPYGRTGKTA